MSKLQLITWEDAFHHSSEWKDFKETETRDDCLAPYLVDSVGWVVAECDDRVVIVPHLQREVDGQQCGKGGMTIPKSCIVSRETIAESEVQA